MAMLLSVPPVSVAVLEAKVLAVSAPPNDDVPEAVKAVTAAVDGVEAPMAMLLIVPPVSVAVLEAKVLAVTEPVSEVVPDAVRATSVVEPPTVSVPPRPVFSFTPRPPSVVSAPVRLVVEAVVADTITSPAVVI
jgi:hypothetical protein